MESTAELRPQRFPGAAPLQVTALHDESGKYKSDRYFVTGFVFVLNSCLQELVTELLEARERHDYWGEVHYKEVREVEGRWGAKFRTTSDWADAIEARMVQGSVRAKVLAVDCRTPTYDHKHFGGRPHFAYNRFTRMALEAGIRWCFAATVTLQLRLLSDEKSRRPGGDDRDPDGDNFASYLPAVTARRVLNEPGWPDVSFIPARVQEVSPGQYHQDCSPECELIQVADLVISSVAAAIRGPSTQPAKHQLARRAARWVRESEDPHLGRLWQKFSSSVFVPGASTPWPKPIPLAIGPDPSEEQVALC